MDNDEKPVGGNGGTVDGELHAAGRHFCAQAGRFPLTRENMTIIRRAIDGGFQLNEELVRDLPDAVESVMRSSPSAAYRLAAAKLLVSMVNANLNLRKVENAEKGVGSGKAINVQVNLFQKLAEGLQAEQIERMKGRLLTVNPELKKDD